MSNETNLSYSEKDPATQALLSSRMNGSMEVDENLVLDAIISKCNASSVREAAGKLLVLPMKDLRKVLEEYDRSPDIRFGENLLFGCVVVQRMRKDHKYSGIFRE
jgi:hypothetical protein